MRSVAIVASARSQQALRPLRVPLGLAVALTATFLLADAGWLPAQAQAPDSEVGSVLEEGIESITEQELHGHVEVLASDDFEGRLPATDGEEKTVSYIRDDMQRAGVAPAVDGGWYQEVPLVRKQLRTSTRLDLESSDRRSKAARKRAGMGDRVDEKLTVGDDFIVGLSELTERVYEENIDLVFAGFGIVAPEYDWNDYAGADVEGKLVLLLMNDPGYASTDSTFFNGKARTEHGRWHTKVEVAAQHGARGVVVIHDPDLAGYPWATLGGGALQSKLSKPAEADDPTVGMLSIGIRNALGEALLREAGHDYAAALAAASDAGFQAFSLGVKASARIDVDVETVTTRNVIGMVPGGEAPDEYVVYTAHWDHMGVGKDVDGDTIYNGAVDNATGTAALMEIAEAFAALPAPPRRSVVFIATTSEEQGLLGAYHYADHPVFPLENTVAVINMDALFPFGAQNGMTVTAMGSSEVEDYLKVAVEQQGRQLQPDPSPEHGAFFRSDHYPFAKKGVPAIFAVGGPLSDPPPSQELIDQYVDYIGSKYHKPSDELHDGWDFAGIRMDAQAFFHTGFDLANDERYPNWTIDNQFRPLRDAMVRAR